jgi:hypothetical protein
VDKFLGVPNHNVPFDLKWFCDDNYFRQSTHVSWCIKIVDNFLDERLDGGSQWAVSKLAQMTIAGVTGKVNGFHETWSFTQIVAPQWLKISLKMSFR